MARRFIGTYYHQFDDKNRLRIPKKLRCDMPSIESLALIDEQVTLTNSRVGESSLEREQIVIFRIEANYLIITLQSEFNKMVEKYNSCSPLDLSSENQKLLKEKRAIMASVAAIEEDSQGRFTLPAKFRKDERLNFNKDVVFLGSGEFIELWSQENYEAIDYGI